MKKKEIKVQSCFYRGPSFAVQFLDRQNLICGMGKDLMVYNVCNGQKNSQIRLPFKGLTSIRVICYSNKFKENGCIVGGQKFLCRVNYLLEALEIVWRMERNDWILDIQRIGRVSFAIGFSHNFIEVWNDNDSNKSPSFLFSSYGESNIFLYSMKIFPSKSIGDIHIASSVVTDIHIWKAVNRESSLDHEKHPKERNKTLCSLSGHDGMIYRIDWKENYIASVSDDRNIKLWTLNRTLDTLIEVKSMIGHLSRPWDVKLVMSSSRDNNNNNGINNVIFLVSSGQDGTIRIWDKDCKMIKILKGHIQHNIWRISVFYDPIEKQHIIASSADDGSFKLFYPKLTSTEEELEKKEKDLSSKSFTHVIPNNEQINHICGNERFIYCYASKLRKILKISRFSGGKKSILSYSVPMKDSSTNLVKTISVTKELLIVSCGKFSEVFIFLIDQNYPTSENDKLISRFLPFSHPTAIFISSKKKKDSDDDDDNNNKIKKKKKKKKKNSRFVIEDFFLLSRNCNEEEYFFAVSSTNGYISFNYLRKMVNEEEKEFYEIQFLTIKKCKDFRIVCAVQHTQIKNIVICGDSGGHVSVFEIHPINIKTEEEEEEEFDFTRKFIKSSFFSVVSSVRRPDIFYFSSRSQEIQVIRLITREKDKDFHLFQQQNQKQNNKYELRLMCQIKTSDFITINKKLYLKPPLQQRVIKNSNKKEEEDDDDLISFGFVGNYFVGSNISKFYRYFSSSERIRRRDFHIYLPSTTTTRNKNRKHGYYTFLDKKSVITEKCFGEKIFSEDYRNSIISLQDSIPNRQIYSSKIFRIFEKLYVCVCSESRILMILEISSRTINKAINNDSLVMMRWWSERDDAMKFVYVYESNKTNGSHLLFSGGGKEEFVIFRVYRKKKKKGNSSNNDLVVHEILKRKLSKQKDIHFRLTSISIQQINNKKSSFFLEEEEEEVESYILFLGSSSSNIKIFQFNVCKDKVTVFSILKELEKEHFGYINCLFCNILPSTTTKNNYFEMNLFSGSSDSKFMKFHLRFFHNQQKFKDFSVEKISVQDLNNFKNKKKIIQRIKCCDFILSYDSKKTIKKFAYGGDDQSILLMISNNDDDHIMKKMKNIHSSSVNGIKFISSQYLISCGDDQRVNILNIDDETQQQQQQKEEMEGESDDDDNNNIQKEKEEVVFPIVKSWITEVSNCRDIDFLKIEKNRYIVIVVGSGIQCWNILLVE